MTLRETIGKLAVLDSRTFLNDSQDPFHCVPRWNEKQYFWMKNTPEGRSAFDNLICLECSHKNHNKESVFCEQCGSLLPRPMVVKDGQARLMKGFKTSYRRMKWDRPASTLTMNSGVISSDVKGHPEQNRVLSLREILLLSTLDHPRWKKRFLFDGIPYGRMSRNQDFSPKLIRQVVGESIPPLGMARIVDHLLTMKKEC